jgi:hypothetical protein
MYTYYSIEKIMEDSEDQSAKIGFFLKIMIIMTFCPWPGNVGLNLDQNHARAGNRGQVKPMGNLPKSTHYI